MTTTEQNQSSATKPLQTSGRAEGGSAAEPRSGANRGSQHRTVRDQTSRIVEDVQLLGEIALGRASEVVEDARRRGGDAIQHGRQRLDERKGDVEEYISANPLKAVLIALGAGALLGFLTRR